jgi:hypothetical protein
MTKTRKIIIAGKEYTEKEEIVKFPLLINLICLNILGFVLSFVFTCILGDFTTLYLTGSTVTSVFDIQVFIVIQFILGYLISKDIYDDAERHYVLIRKKKNEI